MALYPFRCEACSKPQDHWVSISEYRERGSAAFPACATPGCGGALVKLVVPVGEVGTGNTMHQIVDYGLRPGPTPTVFNTRREWEAEMKRCGVRPIEAGAGAEQVKNEKAHKERGDARFREYVEKRMDKAIDKAMATIGGPP